VPALAGVRVKAADRDPRGGERKLHGEFRTDDGERRVDRFPGDGGRDILQQFTVADNDKTRGEWALAVAQREKSDEFGADAGGFAGGNRDGGSPVHPRHPRVGVSAVLQPLDEG
jgi:hypothetical protein